MIVLVHDTNKVISCQSEGKVLSLYHQKSLVKVFFEIAKDHPDQLLIWVHQDYQQAVNHHNFPNIFHHKRIMASYTPQHYLPEAIGYVEQSPFIKVNPDVNYPTWRMHQDVGGINTSVIQALKPYVNKQKDFNYILHSLAKLGQPQGLLCYSQPSLLKPNTILKPLANSTASLKSVYRFIAQHYKWVWKHLLIFNSFIYESRLPILAWLKSCFISQIKTQENLLEHIPLPQLQPVDKSKFDLDVIIPTIGRKTYLYDVLKDLAKQTLQPKRVIIIEQNPDIESESELDYLNSESWPFEIIHKFIHQTGACHARNMALDLVESEWVFLADDDVRLEADYLFRSLQLLQEFDFSVLVTECLQENEQSQNTDLKSWSTFGSGTSILSKEVIKTLRFNEALEHGYGEDYEFGMQIRNIGYDVLFSSKLILKHLKAPIGGFRSKPSLPWGNTVTFPKPSPTVLLSKILHNTKQQILGYKTLLFFITLRNKGLLYLFPHLNYFKKAWANSEYWANQLIKKNA